MFCKTIILSNSQNLNSNAPKGILTLSNTNGEIKGKIRLYNLQTLPLNTKLGIYSNEKVQILTLVKKPQHYEFDVTDKIDLNASLYCALIDNSLGDKKVVLEGGSFNGFYFSDSPFDAVLEAKDDELEQVIDKAMETSANCKECSNCANCEYKKYFYENYADNKIQSPTYENFDEVNAPSTPLEQECFNENLNTQASVEEFNSREVETDEEVEQECVNETLEDTLDQQFVKSQNEENNIEPPNQVEENAQDNKKEIDEQSTFLNDIIYQLDEMFVKYPADDLLNSIIPDSRFIKVEGENTNPYVLGVIYEDKIMKYIAYGVPAKYNSLPPADLGQNYQWLPLNPNDVMSDGYFLIYQNALTGKIVELTIE